MLPEEVRRVHSGGRCMHPDDHQENYREDDEKNGDETGKIVLGEDDG